MDETIAWRLAAAEKALEAKADRDDVDRVEKKVDKQTAYIQALIVIAVGALLSTTTSAIFLAVG